MFNLSQMFRAAVQQYGQRRCLGYRKIVGRINETVVHREVQRSERGEWQKENRPEQNVQTRLGIWEYMTYEEVGQMVNWMALGLKKMVPGDGGKKCIFTLLYYFRHLVSDLVDGLSASWFMLAHAAGQISMPIVGVNAKMGHSDLISSINETGATCVFTDAMSLPLLLSPLVECPLVGLIIYHVNSTIDSDIEKLKHTVESLRTGLGNKIRVISVEQLVETGKRQLNKIVHWDTCDSDTIWGYIYPPSLNHGFSIKALTLTETNVAASGILPMLTVVLVRQADCTKLKDDDTYLSYLPLYAALEFGLVNAFFLSGVTVGFGTEVEKYLLSWPHNKRHLHPTSEGDILSFQPSILYGILPWWHEMHALILKDIKARDAASQEQFWKFYERKKWIAYSAFPLLPALRYCERNSGIDRLRKSFFGHRIRWIGNTCSMMTEEKKEFLGLVLGGEYGIMVEGWTLMELNTIVSYMTPSCHKTKGVGRILPSVELKFKPQKGLPPINNFTIQGQIIIRGPSVPRKSLVSRRQSVKTPRMDKEPDVWLPTSKIGVWDPKQQSLTVLDETRPLLQRYLGEYIPVKTLEAIYQKAPFVSDLMLVHSPKRVAPIAIISINEAALHSFADKYYGNGQEHLSTDDLMLMTGLKVKYIEHLVKVGRENGLVEFEYIANIVMVKGKFTVENGLRLPDGRINKEKVLATYKAEIDVRISSNPSIMNTLVNLLRELLVGVIACEKIMLALCWLSLETWFEKLHTLLGYIGELDLARFCYSR
ncbi:hypothetical protein EDC01DRAFT_759148 [Geopyxis carbonaria]|nr:hypothetical protein EDC01DRAFT_759148 [Geopyxis carbonaria]